MKIKAADHIITLFTFFAIFKIKLKASANQQLETDTKKKNKTKQKLTDRIGNIVGKVE